MRDLVNIHHIDWYKVGQKLGISEYDLEKINENKDRNHYATCKRKMFSKWINQYTDKPTNRTVVQALIDAGQERAADQFCKTHGINKLKCEQSSRDVPKEPKKTIGHLNVVYMGPDEVGKSHVENIFCEVLDENNMEQHDEMMIKLRPYLDKHKWEEVLMNLDYHQPNITFYSTINLGEFAEMNEIAPILFQGSTFHFVCFDGTKSLDHKPVVTVPNTQMTERYPSCQSLSDSVHTAVHSLQGWSRSSRSFSPVATQAYSAMIIGSHKGAQHSSQLSNADNQLSQSIVKCSSCRQSNVKYFEYSKQKVVHPVNIASSGDIDRDRIKTSIKASVHHNVQEQQLPRSWYLFICIMWECKHQGTMKIEDCETLARECCVPDKDISSLITYVHETFGIFLHYRDVSKMNEIVICDPNLLVEAISWFLGIFLNGIPEMHQPSDVRQHGLARAHMIHSAGSRQVHNIPMEYVLALLKCYYFIAEIKDEQGRQHYFFPNILEDDKEVELVVQYDQEGSHPASVTACFFSNLPIGLFTAVCTYLSLVWMLDSGPRYKNKIAFLANKSKVELLARQQCIEVRYLEKTSQIADDLSPILRTLDEAVKTIQNIYHHIVDINLKFQFYYPGSNQMSLCNSNHNEETFLNSSALDEMEVCTSDDSDSIMKQVKKHIQEEGQLSIRVVKSILFGPPQVGKTTTCRRLLGEINNLSTALPPESTGIDKPAMIHLYHDTEQRSVLISDTEDEWSSQSIEEQLGMLVHYILQSAPEKMSRSPYLGRRDVRLEESDTEMNKNSFGTITPDRPCSPVTLFSSSHTKLLSTSSVKSRSFEPPPFQTIQKLIKGAKWKEVRNMLEGITDATILHIIDTGGQPEFYEILPLLLHGPSLSLVFMNLTQELDKPFSFHYQHTSESKSLISYESTFTQQDMLHQLLASVDSEGHRSAAFIIGTRRDEVAKSDIDSLEESIRQSIQNTFFYKRDVLRHFTGKDGREKLVFPLDNLKGSKDEIRSLQKVITNIIKQRFRREPLPTSWAIFHLLLRHSYESKGFCTLDECVELAGSCGIRNEAVQDVLKYFHSRFGTILYYHDVPCMREVVIYDLNIILRPITQLVAESFGANPNEPQTAKEIRRTGEIPFDLVELVCVDDDASDNPIRLTHIFELLKHLHIVSEIQCIDDSMSYFMPCLLMPDIAQEITPENLLVMDLAPLIFTFSTGYVPAGLFNALVVKLSQCHQWEPDEGVRFRNKVGFIIDNSTLTRVELISRISCLEIQMENHNHQTCLWVKQNLEKELKTLMSTFAHMKNTQLEIGFYCPSSLMKKNVRPHFAICRDHNTPQRMMCGCKPIRCSPAISDLQPQHKIWFENYEEPMEIDSSLSPNTCCSDAIDSAGLKNIILELDRPLKIEDLKKLMEWLYRIADKWRMLGTELDIEYGVMETINTDEPKCLNKLQCLLARWINNSNNASWSTMIDALRCNTIDENQLAEEIMADLIENTL